MASALVLTVDDAKTDKYPPIPLTTKVKERTGNDERTSIVAIANNKKSQHLILATEYWASKEQDFKQW